MIEKKLRKYMRYGKLVKDEAAGVVYKLLDNMSADADTVKAIDVNKYERYCMLKAWVKNYESDSMGFRSRFTGDINECAREAEGYVEDIAASDVIPYNKVRFRTAQHDILFEVPDLGYVCVNNEKRQVVYDDEMHFSFVNGFCYHVDEYANICAMYNTKLVQATT